MSFIPITERTLRAAMREPRYWQDGHPEREAFHAWVFQGWRDLVASPHRTADGAGVAFVRAYTRVRNGRTEHVGAHTRSTGAREGGSRPSESSGHDTSARDDQWPDVVPIMGRRPSWLFGGRRPPSPPEGTPGGWRHLQGRHWSVAAKHSAANHTRNRQRRNPAAFASDA